MKMRSAFVSNSSSSSFVVYKKNVPDFNLEAAYAEYLEAFVKEKLEEGCENSREDVIENYEYTLEFVKEVMEKNSCKVLGFVEVEYGAEESIQNVFDLLNKSEISDVGIVGMPD